MEQTVLEAFAKHTRHTKKEANNLPVLARKWLAVHISQPVYSMIAGDYQLLKMRTHEPSLVSYSSGKIDIPTFVHVVRDGLMDNKTIIDPKSVGPVYNRFCETFFPKAVGEEAWVKYERKDHWKKAAYFLALNLSKNNSLYALVETIHLTDNTASREEKDKAAALFDRIGPFAYEKVPPEELGKLISLIELKQPPRVVVVNEVAPAAAQQVFVDEKPVEASVIFTKDDTAPHTWDVLRKNEFVQDYRKRAGLNVTFSTPKMVKQMILASFGYSGKEPICGSLLAPHQTEFASVPKEAWPLLMNALYSFESEPQLDPKSPFIVAFLHSSVSRPQTEYKVSPRKLIQNTLALYMSPEQTDKLSVRRYLKLYPQVDEEIIKAIINL